jgi:peptidylprolyl isomerase
VEKYLRHFVLACSLVACSIAHADETWRALDPDNTLIIDTTKGQIVVELNPLAAPLGVERIKLLARDGTYNGLQFHRVIDGFVAQTGNPNNTDGGASKHPDLAPEFTFKLEPHISYTPAQHATDTISGFIGVFPFQSEPQDVAVKLKRPPRAWGAYCPGALGMGRQDAINTANSEIFFMREASRRLDHDYTMVGMTVAGLDVIRALNVGEPPASPDLMTRVRVWRDVPSLERPRLDVMNTESPAFRDIIAQARVAKGADLSVCDVAVPTRGGGS